MRKKSCHACLTPTFFFFVVCALTVLLSINLNKFICLWNVCRQMLKRQQQQQQQRVDNKSTTVTTTAAMCCEQHVLLAIWNQCMQLVLLLLFVLLYLLLTQLSVIFIIANGFSVSFSLGYSLEKRLNNYDMYLEYLFWAHTHISTVCIFMMISGQTTMGI